MRFIHQHDDIVPGGEHRVLFALVIAELVDQSENEGFVGLQIVPQLFAVLGLTFLFLPNHFRLYEILMDLVIKIFAIGDDQECEIARDLAPNLAGKEHHGKGLAGALGVPENAQLALQLRPILHRFHQIVHAEILMVFGNDLVLLVAEHDKVFDVIHQTIFPQQAVDEIADRAFSHCTGFLQRLTVRPFLLGVNLQPLKEMIVGGVERAEPCLQPIGQHADLVECEQVRDIPQIIFQVVVVSFLYLDDAVFQLDKHHGQAVDENQHIRAAPVDAPLYPHLRNGGEGVVFRTVEIHHLHKIEILFAVAAEADLDAVADLVVVLVIRGRHIRGAEIAAQIPGDLFQLFAGNAGIQARQGLPQNKGEHAFLLAAAPCPVGQEFPLVRGRITAQNTILERVALQLLQDCLFNIVFGYEVAHDCHHLYYPFF